MRHEFLTHVGVADTVAVRARDAGRQRHEPLVAAATFRLDLRAEVDQEVGAEAVVADEHDVAEIDGGGRCGG